MIERFLSPRKQINAAIRFDGDSPVAIEFDFCCGVHRYVALACGTGYEDAPNRIRGYTIPSEALAQGKTGMA